MNVWRIVIIGLGVVGVATFIPVIKTTGAATTITNTTVITRTIPGLEPVTKTTPSPLAGWCRAHDITVAEDIVVFSRITQNIWGLVWERGCGRPPAAYDFSPAMQHAWLERASEAEVRKFIDAMSATDEVGRARLVELANNQVLAAH